MQETLCLEQLKRLIASATDLIEPMNYFFDLMEDEILFKLKDQQIVHDTQEYHELMLVLTAVEQIFTKKKPNAAKIVSHTFNYVPQYYFFHGTCFVSEHEYPLVVLYFSDIHIGLVCAIDAGKNDLYRLTLAESTHPVLH